MIPQSTKHFWQKITKHRIPTQSQDQLAEDGI